MAADLAAAEGPSRKEPSGSRTSLSFAHRSPLEAAEPSRAGHKESRSRKAVFWHEFQEPNASANFTRPCPLTNSMVVSRMGGPFMSIRMRRRESFMWATSKTTTTIWRRFAGLSLSMRRPKQRWSRMTSTANRCCAGTALGAEEIEAPGLRAPFCRPRRVANNQLSWQDAAKRSISVQQRRHRQASLFLKRLARRCQLRRD
jgi:hypothetical protein